jgi:hypothetical protein
MTKSSKGTIAILTGGGDVPGLNPAIRAITIRAIREGYCIRRVPDRAGFPVRLSPNTCVTSTRTR